MKKSYFVVSLLTVVAIISGCRVRDAGQDREPTVAGPGSQGNVVLAADNPTDTVPLPLFTAEATEFPTEVVTEIPTQEPTETPTPTITPSPTLFVLSETPTPTETATLPLFPSETPGGPTETATLGFSVPTNNGNNGFTVPSPTEELPTRVAAIASATPTDIPPSLTPTDTPSLTATPSPTNTIPPTFTPTSPPLAATATFTSFPTLTPTDPLAIAQALSPTPLNSQQLTADAIINGLTSTAVFSNINIQGTQTIQAQLTPFQAGGATATTGFNTPVPFGVATSYPDCEYLIAPGDKLSNIARTYRVTLQQLIDRNPDVVGEEGNFIKAGDILMIPGCGRNPTVTPTGTLTSTLSLSDGQGGGVEVYDNTLGPIEYVVEAGDGIYKLSVQFGVTMTEILQANPQISNINLIIEGQTITIPPRSRFDTPTPTPTPSQ